MATKSNNIIAFRPAPNDTLDNKLRFAIANKRLIQCAYESAMRIVEPHDYGIRGGAPKLLAYQRWKAGRASKDARGWRWLDINKIEACKVLDDTFSGSREERHTHHHDWDVLYARVDQTGE